MSCSKCIAKFNLKQLHKHFFSFHDLAGGWVVSIISLRSRSKSSSSSITYFLTNEILFDGHIAGNINLSYTPAGTLKRTSLILADSYLTGGLKYWKTNGRLEAAGNSLSLFRVQVPGALILCRWYIWYSSNRSSR